MNVFSKRTASFELSIDRIRAGSLVTEILKSGVCVGVRIGDTGFPVTFYMHYTFAIRSSRTRLRM